jgi:hypothetical protein
MQVNVRRNNKPFLYDVTDINGSATRQPKSKRVTNPVAPAYQLPTYEGRVFTPPKKIRDTIAIDDIDGAHPKPPFSIVAVKEPRPIMHKFHDLDGAKPKQLTRDRNRTVDGLGAHPLMVDDITKAAFKSTRTTNPLSPRYVYGRPSNFDLSTHLQLSAGSLVRGRRRSRVCSDGQLIGPSRSAPCSLFVAVACGDLSGDIPISDSSRRSGRRGFHRPTRRKQRRRI